MIRKMEVVLVREGVTIVAMKNAFEISNEISEVNPTSFASNILF